MMIKAHSNAPVERLTTVEGEDGLHLRIARRLAEAAKGYSSQIRLSRVGEVQEVDAKSILGVLSLGAARGESLFIRAQGEDAEEAAEALREILEEDSPGQ